MKKINIIAHVLIALSLLTIFGVTVFFLPFTTEEGHILGDWLKGETMMYLGTMKSIVGAAGSLCVLGIALMLIVRGKTIKRQDILAALFILLGIFTIIGSLTAFYPCVPMMKMNNRPMPCYWTMRTLLGFAGIIGISGALMLMFNRSKEIFSGLSMAFVVMCTLFILIPTKLNGICLSSTMICAQRFNPFVTVMGGMMLTMSVFNMFLLRKRSDDE
ncbi:MAG: DUF4418 family protein [Treponema sp.]|jgi:hypothetical protein|nr:DUF4418 family protein [Treponema sp.]